MFSTIFSNKENHSNNDYSKSPAKSAIPSPAKSPAVMSPGKLKNRLLESVTVGKEANVDDEDIELETKATPYCLLCTDEEKQLHQWIKVCSHGTLKLYRHKKTGKTRLVHRNRTGTVKLNVSIAGGMCELEKVLMKVKTRSFPFRVTKEVEVVKFYALACEERGVECFMIKVKEDKLGSLFQKLKEMGAHVKAIDP